MATKLYDCLIATSKYKDRNGQEKRKWENVGAIWQDKDNNGNIYEYLMLKRCFNPAGIEAREGSDAIRISLFKPKPPQTQQQQTPTQQTQHQNQGWGQNNFNGDFNSNNSNFDEQLIESPF